MSLKILSDFIENSKHLHNHQRQNLAFRLNKLKKQGFNDSQIFDLLKMGA